MAHSATTERRRLRTTSGLRLRASFDAGRLTSEGGWPWLAEADQALGLCGSLARCVPEWRHGPVQHSRLELLRQRVFQIACGDADQNDASPLRSDPLLTLVGGRLPESGTDLASQATLCRLENAVDRHAGEALAAAVVAISVQQRQGAGAPQHLVLDLDGTDDPAHGRPPELADHGFDRQPMDYPLLVFDGQTGQLITAVLRPGNVHGSRFVVLVLRRLPKRLRTVGQP